LVHAAPLILVVGMHRSGTSLLGSLLQGLGVELPGELIAADHHNPEGYFEWHELVELQERLWLVSVAPLRLKLPRFRQF
jgi:hypothetical protein